MDLQIKHLAPYLQYELDVIIDGQSNPEKLTGLYYSVSDLPKIFALTPYKDYISLKDIKPVLRPLKDLTEIIKGKGVSYTSYLWYEVISTDNDSFNKDEFYENCELGMVEFLPIMVYEHLIKWNFDIFKLIPKGLAIDINTLSVE